MPQLGTNRKKGTGSIRERSAGHYELRYYDKATQRQAVRTFVAPRAERGASIRAARAALAALVADVEAGRYVYSHDAKAEPALDPEAQPGTRTVGEVLDEWLAHCESVGRAHTTRHGYSIRAERFKAAIGNVAVSALGARDVDRLYAHWRAEGMSQAGVVHHHRVLRAAGAALGEGAYVWTTTVDALAPRTPDSITRAFVHLCDTLDRGPASPRRSGSMT